jgi:hypothetical protein
VWLPNLSKVGEHNHSIAVFIPTLDGLAYVLALATLGSELLRLPLRRSSQNFYSRHWCENSLSGGSIFMVSGWPGKDHGSLG